MNVIVVLFLVGLSLLPIHAAAAQPNVVLVVADDLDKALFDRLYGEGLLPAIRDHIGTPGTTFSNAFVTESLCCPSRATILTGQYAHNNGVLDNGLPLGGVTRFADATALPVWLKSTDYISGFLGKYLNGYGLDSGQPVSDPRNPRYVPPGWDFWRGLVTLRMYGYSVSQWDVRSGGAAKLVSYGNVEADYQTDKLATMASNFIGALDAPQYDAKPFFLLVAPYAPHVVTAESVPETTCESERWRYLAQPAARHVGTLAAYFATMPQGAGFNESDVSDKPDWVRAHPVMTAAEIECAQLQYQRRAESMLAVDDMVATIAARLTASGELGNTVLIFMSDNGYYLGGHRLAGKIVGYEDGIRMPLLMRGPGIPAAVILDRLILNNDLAPTIAAWGAATPLVPQDGRSLVPLLVNPVIPWRTRFLVEYQGAAPERHGTPKFLGVRTDHTDWNVQSAWYAAWEDASASEEYYELATDPAQIESRHADPATQVARTTMQGYLDALKSCGQDGQPACAAVE